MNEIQIFAFEGAEVRTVLADGEPWWVASDVCSVLDVQSGRALARLDEDEKGLRSTQTPGGQQMLSYVNEPGLYSLVLGSRKPQAKAFKRWITHEVIPALRKHGSYSAAPKPLEITAAAGPVSYREQAEILAILRPILPEPYAAATGKVILSRAMGERPALEPSETPLYASTFLAEKGHKAGTVAKFQSGFGARVSNRYFKVRGRRPEKIPGPAGSRIDKVAVYSEVDRPLLEQVYMEIAEQISSFETGGQYAIGA
ncbi:Bro-N domain-containing protein [Streptomyces sp. NPDC059569]|uniref:BRO-N domain-containing protein n=1 Tax=Streptomyces sp. NPDC059569 TaxID=3346869 RepID=UPI003695788F